jgi:DNA-binding NtrC family response regulator
VQKDKKPSHGKLSPLLFLIVDDDADIGECVGFTISLTEHTSEYYQNPLDALQAFKDNQTKYHAIFTDLRMPEMTGEKLIAEIRKFNQEIPIIIMTATTGIFSTDDLVKLNVPSFLTKPFDLSDVELAVKLVEEYCFKQAVV